jgi:hypothetical protein
LPGEDDVDHTEVLTELEAIKRLKARYCRLLDTKDWDSWRQVFTDGFISDTSGAGGSRIEGADAFVAFVRGTLGRSSLCTVHQVHAPEIELTSATTASGVWALEDVLRFLPGLTMRGFGHYTETYEKVDGSWRIATSTLTRLREDLQTPLVSLFVGPRLRRLMQRAAGAA